MKLVFNYLVFPGFLFSAVVGLFSGWFDRKLTARIQWRKGPPWYQNFLDILKLFSKEVIIPTQAKFTFFISPFVGLCAVVIVSTMLGRVLLDPSESFIGDLIVLVYLLVIPAIALILGASSSGNPLAAVGASREMKLILGYELPFILSILTLIIKTGAIKLEAILNHQMVYGSHIASFSGVIAFLVTLLCIQAKLGAVPFDISEAEQEIMAGTLIEYSGPLLALFKLTRAILLYIMPLFLTILFIGKDISFKFLFLKYIGLITLIILLKNTNPRLKIEQAIKFFWGPVSFLACVSVILALRGW
ncbi:MAG: NADH-quinone oxidoreductase subunit H [Candidatus Omnitrophica bacterium]|nr:NADH-quinone oxidoreductase subunit H [Candidatus Omnitrophota bacterium]